MAIYYNNSKVTDFVLPDGTRVAKAYLGDNKVFDADVFNYEQIVNYTMFYDHGDQCEDVTGGWASTKAVGDGKTRVEPLFESDGVVLSLPNYTYRESIVNTINKMDLSQYTKMLNKYDITNAIQWGSFNITSDLTSTSGEILNRLSNGAVVGAGDVGSYLKIIDCAFDSGYLYLGISKGYNSDGNGEIKMYTWCGFKSDDWQTLATLAGISATSIDDILANSTTLLSNKVAVNFMLKQCTGEFMASAITSETFLEALDKSEFKTIVIGNEHWFKFLSMVCADEYFEQEQVVNYVMAYDYGNECEDVTGGWSTDALSGIKFNGTTMSRAGTSEKLEDCLHLTQQGITGSFKYISANTAYRVNMTDFVEAIVKYEGIQVVSGSTLAKIMFMNTSLNIGDVNVNYTEYWSAQSYTIEPFGNYTSILEYETNSSKNDLRGLSGDYYIVITTFFGSSSDGKRDLSIFNLTFFKEDDWITLAEKAGISATSIDDILANSATLLSNQEAVNFMVYNCTGEFMAKAITSETFLTALNESAYKETIQNNAHWGKFLNMVA